MFESAVTTIDPPRNGILDILYPEAGRLRSRNVISRSKCRGSGKYPSWKMDRMLHWESPYELFAFRLLDACPSVIAHYEQPLAIRYVLDGEIHTHHPDLLVKLMEANREELWEVKPLAEALRPEVIARTRLLESALPSWGFTYRMAVAEELARQPRLATVNEFLKHGRSEPVSDIAREHIRQIFLKRAHICWASAENGDLGPRGRAALCRLVLEGVLSFNFEKPLKASSRFTWQNPDETRTGSDLLGIFTVPGQPSSADGQGPRKHLTNGDQ